MIKVGRNSSLPYSYLTHFDIPFFTTKHTWLFLVPFRDQTFCLSPSFGLFWSPKTLLMCQLPIKVPKTTYCQFKLYVLIGLVITTPENLETAVQENSIEISFKMGNTTGIKHYEIELETDEGKNTVETNDNSESYVIKNLQSEMEYKIRLRAVSHHDRKSKWSISVTAYMCKLYRREDQLGIQPVG